MSTDSVSPGVNIENVKAFLEREFDLDTYFNEDNVILDVVDFQKDFCNNQIKVIDMLLHLLYGKKSALMNYLETVPMTNNVDSTDVNSSQIDPPIIIDEPLINSIANEYTAEESDSTDSSLSGSQKSCKNEDKLNKYYVYTYHKSTCNHCSQSIKELLNLSVPFPGESVSIESQNMTIALQVASQLKMPLNEMVNDNIIEKYFTNYAEDFIAGVIRRIITEHKPGIDDKFLFTNLPTTLPNTSNLYPNVSLMWLLLPPFKHHRVTVFNQLSTGRFKTKIKNALRQFNDVDVVVNLHDKPTVHYLTLSTPKSKESTNESHAQQLSQPPAKKSKKNSVICDMEMSNSGYMQPQMTTGWAEAAVPVTVMSVKNRKGSRAAPYISMRAFLVKLLEEYGFFVLVLAMPGILAVLMGYLHLY